VGDLKIDPSDRIVHYQGKKIRLTLTEFDILRHLALHPNAILSREDILKAVWRDESQQELKDTNDRIIDVHIRALRKKIPSLSTRVVSVYGMGYKYIP
jgi:DNA-binding response OmpR family regulator